VGIDFKYNAYDYLLISLTTFKNNFFNYSTEVGSSQYTSKSCMDNSYNLIEIDNRYLWVNYFHLIKNFNLTLIYIFIGRGKCINLFQYIRILVFRWNVLEN